MCLKVLPCTFCVLGFWTFLAFEIMVYIDASVCYVGKKCCSNMARYSEWEAVVCLTSTSLGAYSNAKLESIHSNS